MHRSGLTDREPRRDKLVTIHYGSRHRLIHNTVNTGLPGQLPSKPHRASPVTTLSRWLYLSMFMTIKPRTFLRLILSFCVTACAAQTRGTFSPLEQWRAAIIRGDANSLKALYSNQPPARISVITKGASEVSADSDTAFWTGLKARHMELKISQ